MVSPNFSIVLTRLFSRHHAYIIQSHHKTVYTILSFLDMRCLLVIPLFGVFIGVESSQNEGRDVSSSNHFAPNYRKMVVRSWIEDQLEQLAAKKRAGADVEVGKRNANLYSAMTSRIRGNTPLEIEVPVSRLAENNEYQKKHKPNCWLKDYMKRTSMTSGEFEGQLEQAKTAGPKAGETNAIEESKRSTLNEPDFSKMFYNLGDKRSFYQGLFSPAPFVQHRGKTSEEAHKRSEIEKRSLPFQSNSQYKEFKKPVLGYQQYQRRFNGYPRFH